MTEEIILREYQKSDARYLAEIIRDTWKYGQLCSSKAADKLAKVYLNSCLANQTFTQVVLIDNIPAGIIMGKNIAAYRCPLKYRIPQILSILSLYLNKEARNVSRIFQAVTSIDEDLLKESGRSYDGEVAFFAVNSMYRGKGIGKKLFHSLTSYMKEQGLENFFLFTDTSCNYPFYEHQGMQRRCQISRSFEIGSRHSEMTFFLYDFEMSPSDTTNLSNSCNS